jgi:hypothetical protein
MQVKWTFVGAWLSLAGCSSTTINGAYTDDQAAAGASNLGGSRAVTAAAGASNGRGGSTLDGVAGNTAAIGASPAAGSAGAAFSSTGSAGSSTVGNGGAQPSLAGATSSGAPPIGGSASIGGASAVAGATSTLIGIAAGGAAGSVGAGGNAGTTAAAGTRAAAGGASAEAGSRATGGATAMAEGGSSATGGAVGTAGAGAAVLVASGPWNATASGESIGSLPLPAIEATRFLLVAAVAHATQEVSVLNVTEVSKGSLQLTRLSGGPVAGTRFCSEFWGARLPQGLPSGTLSVKTDALANIGMAAWALTGVNASTPVGTVLEPSQVTLSTYQESFPNKISGSMLFGAFFDGDYASNNDGFLPIVPLESSLSAQSFAGYFVYSKTSSGSGLQTIGATLPGTWTIYHSAIEILP